jgi:cytochrome c553
VRTIHLVSLGAVAGTLVTGLVGCGRPATQEPGPQVSRMTEHFVRAGKLYAAVASGSLDSVRRRAQEILDTETGEGLPARSQRYVRELRSFTSLAARAPDVESAASAVARAGAACGACHASLRQGPRYPGGTLGGPAPTESDVMGRMQRHRWASDRLWEGLIGPSDSAWQAGAEVLKDAALYTDALTRDLAQYEQITKLAWTVHEIGARAGALERHDRAELYGQLLGTCARCHAVLLGGN